MSYEFWIPAVFIALAGASLLIDFDPADPAEPASSDPDADLNDLSMLDEPLDNIDEIAPVGYPLVAANSPDAPTRATPDI